MLCQQGLVLEQSSLLCLSRLETKHRLNDNVSSIEDKSDRRISAIVK